ncbi:PREDICTED: GTP-binding protein 10 [Dipodomys ordii]|uniref:GTP-binding protein 10 n=1 Tax=Dipodomys ordii TaxID=10020 RepID=A0A1S3FYK4_DIPOR|nr:PREDICTED: GTP-binding protein 10 [Dipodomys ordii]
MVHCSGVLFRKYGKFIDKLRVFTKGGSGGMGYPRLGGEGGKGGDVWVVAHKRMTLRQLKDKYPQKRFVAGVGANSRVNALKGSKGKDCEIPVPVGISVTDENGKIIGELNKEEDRILVAEGGLGGKLLTNFLPLKGQKRTIYLDLKLIADVGLVGFPNAGKSSLLSQVSRAKPAIADYAYSESYNFTKKSIINNTFMELQAYVISYFGSNKCYTSPSDLQMISVADLPGLIEGAHKNKGMGHKFLKHIERTRQLLFVVDVSGFQLSSQTQYRTAFETVMLLTKELELYKEELHAKPALLVINKMDLPDAQDKFHELMYQLQNPKDFLHLFEKEMIPEKIVEFQHVIPISAITGEGIEELKSCIRKSLDEHTNQENEAYHEKQLLNLRTFNTVI